MTRLQLSDVLPDFVRIVALAIPVYISIAYDIAFLMYFTVFFLVQSVAWLFLVFFSVVDQSENPRLTILPTTLDVIGLTLLLYLTGSYNSPVLIGYVGLVGVSSTNTRVNQGLYQSVLCIGCYAVICVLVLTESLPHINVLGDVHDTNVVEFCIGGLLFLLSMYGVHFYVRGLAVRNEELLLNILPSKVANDIRRFGTYIPRSYEEATVLFTDFCDFTASTRGISADVVLESLDYYFSTFDSITHKYNLEKLKTIGDGYMCAGGIPETNSSHPVDACIAALEIQAFVKSLLSTREEKPILRWPARIGIHTGPLIAGVIGKVKFAYDIWGETVNTASRYESSTETGGVCVSQSTYRVTRSYFDYSQIDSFTAKRIGKMTRYKINAPRQEYLTNDSIDIDYEIVHENILRSVSRDCVV